jgi:HD-like signal output (HDOD) protein
MTMKVLYLDDPAGQARVRDGLPELGDSWEFHFTDNPRQALLAMSMFPFAAVVAGQALAGQGERHLFNRMKESHPTAVRILMNEVGQGDVNLGAVGLAHQVLVKPADAATICETIQNALRLGDLFLTREFRKQIAGIVSLPTPPATYRQLVREFQNPEVRIDRVVEIMSRDLGLMAKLLQIVNSAFFGLSSEVKDLKHAVTLLGLELVRTLALASGVFNRFPVDGMGYLTADWLADHGAAVGRRAKGIAEALELETSVCDMAMLAGLLHDTGKLIQLAFFRDKIKAAGSLAIKQELPLHLAEQALTGVDHSRMGAHLLALWGLPFPLVEAVAFHHDPLQSGEARLGVLTAVHLADAFIWEDYGGRTQPLKPTGGSLDLDYLAALGIDEARVTELRELELSAPR